MLLQSHEGFINPLPALPSEWTDGVIHGFKVRGGATVSLSWTNGRLEMMELTGGWQKDLKILVPEGTEAWINGRKAEMKNGPWLELVLEKGRKTIIEFRGIR